LLELPVKLGGSDGGSRPLPPAPAPTHGESLGELFRTKAADVGRRLWIPNRAQTSARWF